AVSSTCPLPNGRRPARGRRRLHGYNTASAERPLSPRNRSRPMDKVLLVIGDAAEVFDTLYPLYRIREDGYQVLVAAPEKRTYHLVMHDSHPDWDITVESPGYKLKADIAFRDIRPEEYAGLVITGGRAPEYLRYDADLMRVTRYFAEKNLPIGSVCHGIE